jgi:amino acid adenylation domain-containing protein
MAGLVRGVLAQVRRNPDAIAVVDGARRLTYRELDAASAALAGALRERGIRPGDAVAVCLPRGWQLVCAMLGIRRLGVTVVPLDAQSPAERQRYMLADSASVALIVQEPVDLAGVCTLPIAELLPEPPVADSLSESADPEADAAVSFLFYTSGTTGQPKGVEVRDAGILRLARPGYFRLAAGLRYGCLSNPAFDALSFEVWTPLLTGGCCVILDTETVATPYLLAAALRDERVDAMFVTAALFNAVVLAEPDCFASVGQVLIGGEQLNARLIRRWYADNPGSASQLYNAYGPTEATTFALCYPIPRDCPAEVLPIGRPLPETEAVLVADGRLAEPGEPAELYLAGAGLAAGYRNLPSETADRFVGLPWLDGGSGRYYRTGDLVRSDSAGLISYLGRTDRQVKVRGFRIEPDEVERQLLAHPAVRQAHVCIRQDAERGSTELLAYLVAGDELSYAELDRHLAGTLPGYMRPHRLYRLAALPRNSNGKVDSAALLARTDPPWRAEPAGVVPSGVGREREFLELVGEVLGVPEPSPADNLLHAGGDSLAALRLRFAIRRRWGCELPQAEVLRADFGTLAQAVAGSAADSPYPPLPAPSGARSAPATSEQQRLWLLQQQDPDSCAYNVGLAFQLTGRVELPALRAAVRRLVDRHPALRTGFQAAPDGLRQLIGDPYDPWLMPGEAGELMPGEAGELMPGEAGELMPGSELPPDEDGQNWQSFARRLFGTPFDLAQPRMLQACWLATPHGGVLLLHLHHIAVDGWSLNLLFAELSADYAGELPESAQLVPTTLDYAGWQAEWFGSPAYRAHRAELREEYAALDSDAAPPLPVRSAAGSAAGLVQGSLDAAGCARVDRLGAELGLTRFELLLGAFAWSVYAVTGRTRPRVASPVAGRPVQEFEASVGMFANTVLLPLQVSPSESLRSQLLRQSAAVRAVLDRQDVALADVLDDHDFRTDGPLFDFLFVLDNTDFGALSLPGCESRPVWLAPPGAKCPLTLSLIERADGLDCLWEYAVDHLDAAEVSAMAELFTAGLDRLAAEPATSLAELAAGYRAGLPDPGRGPSLPLAYRTIADGFARQVRQTPDAIALADGERRISYAELDSYAAALAGELLARFGPPGDGPCHIALQLPPSVEHIVALLALARLNITAVPLDPAYPPGLLSQILSQAKPICVLVPPGGQPALIDSAVPRHPVLLGAAVPLTNTVNPSPAGRRPLYTLFTSGSTGTPKGVQVPDETLCNLLQWQDAAGDLPDGARTQQFSMLSFDVSFQEIFGTLCGGGCLHLIRPGWRHDMPALLDQLEIAGIERIHLPYVALQLLAEHGARLAKYPSRLRDVVTAGEQLLCTDAIRRWFAGMPGARLFNHYGPTETHVVSGLCLAGDPAGWPDRPAIGTPVAGAWLRVVDEADQPLPPDCPGELLIGGLPAVPCYLDDPAGNAARFVELPGIGRCYRSGDRARFDSAGLLHFLGRDDEQVKVSGHRLELGQVEAALASHPAVGVAVVAQDGGQLVACLEFQGEPPAVEELAGHLAARLPAYVRVDRFRRVAELPRTASGKLDRRRVLAVAGEELIPRGIAGPALSPRERQLTGLFEEVIGRPIEPDQRFFDAGASSLGLMRFHLRATAELDLAFSIPDLFEHVTIRRLARFLDEAVEASDHVEPAEGAWPDEPIAIVGMAVRLPGADDLAGFWTMVQQGDSGISYFDAEDGLVGARSQLSRPLGFDPEHFGISRAEARLMDPQQRHLLMSCVQALAAAGIADPAAGRVGLVASCGENTYFQALLAEADRAQLPDGFQLALHHDKDFLATKVAYHLGLTGPAFTVQAACASSLVAVHIAAGLLRQGDSEVMLAAGVLVDPLLTGGYRYRPQHIFSVDGHCRPFSDDASGTIGASGVGVVVLKPLRLAVRDGDTVYALVTGSAVNNDGAGKLSYTAPAVAGQREVIRAALRRSGRPATDLGYIEAHGTGTELGDPVEVAALCQAYQLPPTGECALASVKSQIGHLGAAAGVVGLIRAALAVHSGRIPPNIDFRRLNPQIGSDADPFSIPTEARQWPADRPRVAAVSSFGIGGTNAHLILEAGPPAATPSAWSDCLLLSASSEQALRSDAGRIADYLAGRPGSYRQVLRHLQAGRPVAGWRAAADCPDVPSAVAWLRSVADGTVAGSSVAPTGTEQSAGRRTAAELVTAWLAGDRIHWPAGPAQPPWDFPPPSFVLTDYEFPRVESAVIRREMAWPARLPEAEWLSQSHWVPMRAAGPAAADPAEAGVLVVLAADELDPALLHPFAGRRVVRVAAASGFARLAPDAYRVDPADAGSLRQLLEDIAPAGPVDWLHLLPLAVDGPVGAAALARARWACLDSPAALLQAVDGMPQRPALRIWWVSCRAQPVHGTVARPELGLLAGPSEVVPQECGVPSHWLDLADPDPAGWVPALAGLLAGAEPLPRRLALRDGYWWRQLLLPVDSPESYEQNRSELLADRAVHLVLGGTGGIGSTVAAWLLARSGCRVLLLARRPRLPAALTEWADRIELVEADLAAEPIEQIAERIGRHTDRLDGVVHAAGVAAGSPVVRRDAAGAISAGAAKLQGALLIEQLVRRYRPAFALYCSSLSAQLGGAGQLDYVAANGLLDGFARSSTASTLRLGIDWDVWREAGMARDALPANPRHQAHLATGLTVAEAGRVLDRAFELRLPQLLVCTTELTKAAVFYAADSSVAPAASGPAPAELAPAEHLAGWLCHWLGVDELDEQASLYQLGADSLTLLDLAAEIKDRYGVDLGLSELSHQVSLAEILTLLERQARPASADDAVTVQVWQAGSGSAVLCLLHPVGGDIAAYRPLVGALDVRLTVCLIADPALRDRQLSGWSLAERAHRYTAALEARFPSGEWNWRLAGWSFGGWLALAMAAEVEAAGRPAAAVYLIDPPPPDAGPRLAGYQGAQLEAVFAHELAQAADRDDPASISTEAAAYAERLARCCRANLASMAGYSLPALTGTPVRLWLAGQPMPGMPAPAPAEQQAGQWQALLPTLAGWQSLPASHYGIVRPPQVRSIAEAISAASLPVLAAS